MKDTADYSYRSYRKPVKKLPDYRSSRTHSYSPKQDLLPRLTEQEFKDKNSHVNSADIDRLFKIYTAKRNALEAERASASTPRTRSRARSRARARSRSRARARSRSQKRARSRANRLR